jgi:hypothetical protein
MNRRLEASNLKMKVTGRVYVSVLNSFNTAPRRLIREWRYSSTILDHDTRLKCVVSFTPLPLYSGRKSPW